MIPQLLLEEINCGEKNARDYYKKYGKEELELALNKLKADDAQIFAVHPVDVMKEKFIEKAMFNKNNKTKFKRGIYTWGMSVAASLLVILSIPLMVGRMNMANQVSEIRVKGNSSTEYKIKLYRQVNNQAEVLKNETEAAENDVIQITYIAGENDYGNIFSVDGNGNVTHHFPQDGWKSAKLEKKGNEVPLAYSYVLDDAPEYECFVFVVSKKPFEINDIEKSKFSVDFLKMGEYLPKDCKCSVFVLKK